MTAALEQANRIYELCSRLRLERTYAEDRPVHALFDAARELRIVQRELDATDAPAFIPAYRLMRWLAGTPLLPLEIPWFSRDVVTALGSSIRQLELNSRALYAAASTLVERLEKVADVTDLELRAAFLAKVREKPASIVLVSDAQFVAPVESLLEHHALANPVVHAGSVEAGRGARDAITVGPISRYPSHLFASPRFEAITNIGHAWKRESFRLPSLPGTTRPAVNVSFGDPAGVAGSANPAAAAAKIDVDELLQFLSRAAPVLPAADADDEVPAALVELAGDHFMLIAEGTQVRVFEFAAPEPAEGTDAVSDHGITTSYVQVECLEPGMYILERTRGATPALEEAAEALVQDAEDMVRLRASRDAWKRDLQNLVVRHGLATATRMLSNCGCRSASSYLVRHWIHNGTILPEEEACLKAILRLAGREQDIEETLRCGHAYRSMRLRAGMAISLRLIERLAATVDRTQLGVTGTADVMLDEKPHAPKMTMFRVVRAGQRVTVPRAQLKIVYAGLAELRTEG